MPRKALCHSASSRDHAVWVPAFAGTTWTETPTIAFVLMTNRKRGGSLSQNIKHMGGVACQTQRSQLVLLKRPIAPRRNRSMSPWSAPDLPAFISCTSYARPASPLSWSKRPATSAAPGTGTAIPARAATSETIDYGYYVRSGTAAERVAMVGAIRHASRKPALSRLRRRPLRSPPRHPLRHRSRRRIGMRPRTLAADDGQWRRHILPLSNHRDRLPLRADAAADRGRRRFQGRDPSTPRAGRRSRSISPASASP